MLAGALVACGSGEDAMETDGVVEEVAQEVREELIEPEPEYEGDPWTERRTIEAGGLDREYVLTVPPGVEMRDGLPLIIAFHGYKNSADFLRKLTQFDQANAVVAYMEGRGDAWAPAPYAQTTGEQDLAFFDAVRQSLIDEYPINPAKVFVAGMSNGGGFAAYTACHRSHQVTGIATVSAAFYDTVFEDCSPTPVKQIDFHGTQDGTMEYEGGIRHSEPYMPVMEVMNAAAERNYCEVEPAENAIRRPGGEYVWNDCDAALEHYRLDGEGHVWPGSKQDVDREGQPADGFASEAILDFFKISYRGELGPK